MKIRTIVIGGTVAAGILVGAAYAQRWLTKPQGRHTYIDVPRIDVPLAVPQHLLVSESPDERTLNEHGEGLLKLATPLAKALLRDGSQLGEEMHMVLQAWLSLGETGQTDQPVSEVHGYARLATIGIILSMVHAYDRAANGSVRLTMAARLHLQDWLDTYRNEEVTP